MVCCWHVQFRWKKLQRNIKSREGGTLHKFGQGCSFENIFSLPQKITGFKFKTQKITGHIIQTQKITALFVPKTDVFSFQYKIELNQHSSRKIRKRVSANLVESDYLLGN